MTISHSEAALSSEQNALLSTFRALLLPMAQLALSKGVSYAALDELLRSTLVDAARQQWTGTQAHGLVSRVSTATGLNRREVTRLLSGDAASSGPKRWLAGEVFTKWLSEPLYKRNGKPLAIPRQGPAPSFEALAHSVTKDLHPRSLLDELCRLDMASIDEATDTVHLVRDAMVPKSDFTKMVSFIADNVGEHLEGSVANVLGEGDAHFDQAIVADELSLASIGRVRSLIQLQWQQLFDNLVPQLSALIASDQQAGAPQNQQVRIGLYSLTKPMASPPSSDGA